MSARENASNCYTHSREFVHDGYDFQVRINDDLMSYTVTVSYDGETVATVPDLGPEAAQGSHAVLAETVLG